MQRIILIFFLLIANSILYSQEQEISLNIVKFLNENQLITLPTNAGFFTENLEFKPTIFDCDYCKQGFYYQWAEDENFFLIYAEDTDGSQHVTINYYGDKFVDGLPVGLIFNETTEEECYYRYKKYNPSRYQ